MSMTSTAHTSLMEPRNSHEVHWLTGSVSCIDTTRLGFKPQAGAGSKYTGIYTPQRRPSISDKVPYRFVTRYKMQSPLDLRSPDLREPEVPRFSNFADPSFV
ncbi:hypothetical protein TNCV_1439751 [Trichonephila clavipes]|nr:hypothetical protein TNCV_1439751 [Trichonephila clavipes]